MDVELADLDFIYTFIFLTHSVAYKVNGRKVTFCCVSFYEQKRAFSNVYKLAAAVAEMEVGSGFSGRGRVGSGSGRVRA